MSGYATIVLVLIALFIRVNLDDLKNYMNFSDTNNPYRNDFFTRFKIINRGLTLISFVAVLSFGLTWWTDRNGLPTDEIAVKAFTASSDGLSVSDGTAEGYCYGPGGGIESSAPCVLIVSAPRVIERPDSESDQWCFFLNYLIETDSVDRGIDWSDRTLRTDLKEVSVCGRLELSDLNGNGTKYDYRSWQYISEDRISTAIRNDNNY